MDVGMLAMWSDIDRVIIIFVLSEKCANNGDRSGKYTWDAAEPGTIKVHIDRDETESCGFTEEHCDVKNNAQIRNVYFLISD